MKKQTNILGIDRGSKYIGLAYMSLENRLAMPIGYIMNDRMTIATIADMLMRYQIKAIAIGYPKTQKDIQERIEKFVKSLSFVIDSEILIDYVDEDYTSVQAGEVVSKFKKNASTDTVSAMLILDRRIEQNNLT